MNDNGKKLNEIKEQPDKKLKELSDDELAQVTGGNEGSDDDRHYSPINGVTP